MFFGCDGVLGGSSTCREVGFAVDADADAEGSESGRLGGALPQRTEVVCALVVRVRVFVRVLVVALTILETIVIQEGASRLQYKYGTVYPYLVESTIKTLVRKKILCVVIVCRVLHYTPKD